MSDKPLRLKEIRICGYRAFPHPMTISLNSKNLLLFGENGSGKSSLGKALRDFLDFNESAVPFDQYKYRFADPARTDRKIELVFDDSTIDILEWNPTLRDKAHKDFNDMARSRAWVDYRSIWRISEVQGLNNYVEIFVPLVEEILTSCLPKSGGSTTFGEKWNAIKEKAAEKPIRQGSMGYKAVDFLQKEIEQFNVWLESFLPDLEAKANDLLKVFVPWTELKVSYVKGAAYNSTPKDKFSNGSIQLQMLVQSDTPLESPSEFINEARITAIGLCLYIAGMSLSIPPKRTDKSTYPRLLILDDVLLSLDMAHRRPLLKLLKSKMFDDWQIILLTHDRSWYEIAQQQLEGWINYELFAQRVGDYEQPVLLEDQDYLLKAIDYLHEGHIKAAAVHLRTKFELVLKSACTKLGVSVKYNSNTRFMQANDFWMALCGATIEVAPPVKYVPDGKNKLRWYQPKAEKHRVVSPDLQKRIKCAVHWILNPLSHSESVERYSIEIEDAIFVIAELEQAVRFAIAIKSVGPVLLREMLLDMLKSRITTGTSGSSNA